MIWYYDYAFKYANYKDDKTKKYKPRTLIPYPDQVQYYIITVGVKVFTLSYSNGCQEIATY